MGRAKGSKNKGKLPEVFLLDEQARLQIIAALIVDILYEEMAQEGSHDREG